MAVGPIPFTAIDFYVDRFGLPDWCVDALMMIDRECLAMVSDRNAE